MVVGYLAHRLSQEEPDNGPLHLRATKIVVKRGDEILDGPYPKHFTEFVGQDKARKQLIAAITSAIERQKPLGHVLFASGFPGVGKTSLARLTAHLLGVGFVELGGQVKDSDAAAAVREMQDGDVLFLDEIHRLVSGGRMRAEWLLPLMQDGQIQMPGGTVQAPDITIIGATTDAQKLPKAMLERFKLAPPLESYTRTQAVRIAKLHAARVGFGTDLEMPDNDAWLGEVCAASDNNPRRIGNLLELVRDSAIAARAEGKSHLTENGYDISEALHWAGLTPDGLTMGMQEYLTALHFYGGQAGIATIKAALNESDVTHTEATLIQRGWVQVASSGRKLTESGAQRAEEVALALYAAEAARHSEES